MGPPVYELKDVVQAYGTRTVLNVPDLQVQDGEVLAVVGPSGAGKSTLLRLLSFLEAPSQGRLAFGGRWLLPGEAPPLAQRRRVSMVFQQPLLLSGSVADNVAYGLKVRGCRDGRIRIDAALDQVGLTPLRQAAARTLSGGERQRVALARALVTEPSVLLLDEPTANLDPAHVALIEEVIRQANRQRGVTVVLVTHNIFQARRLAHRVALLVAGRLVEVAPTADLFERPKDAQTRAFVSGEMVY
ncbi:MAG: ABC transporter ATP-binding protein [Anaerolineae bacterium]